jgi:hypothetical protein
MTVTLATALVVSCGLLVSHDEVARATSPDGRIDAVTVEVNGGATARFGYDIYLVPRGWLSHRRVHVARFYDAVRRETPDDVAYGVNVRWDSGRTVLVEYLAAQNADLLQGQAEVAGQNISVALRAGISDPAAPSGGMLYNSRK